MSKKNESTPTTNKYLPAFDLSADPSKLSREEAEKLHARLGADIKQLRVDHVAEKTDLEEQYRNAKRVLTEYRESLIPAMRQPKAKAEAKAEATTEESAPEVAAA